MLSRIDEEDVDDDNTAQKAVQQDYVNQFEMNPAYNPFTATQEKRSQDTSDSNNPFRQSSDYTDTNQKGNAQKRRDNSNQQETPPSSQSYWPGAGVEETPPMGDGLNAKAQYDFDVTSPSAQSKSIKDSNLNDTIPFEQRITDNALLSKMKSPVAHEVNRISSSVEDDQSPQFSQNASNVSDQQHQAFDDQSLRT